MITIILWTLSLVEWQVGWELTLLILAQSFCLAGDIFLLLPEWGFMVGLAAFLVGHLFYLGLVASIFFAGLESGAIESLSPLLLIVGVIGLGVVIMVFLRVFKPALNAKGSSSKIWLAVQVYAFVLSTMMIATFVLVLARSGLTWQSLLVPLGGVLFFASDFMLAYDRFVKKNVLLRLLVWISYHLAQICLAIGFAAMIA